MFHFLGWGVGGNTTSDIVEHQKVTANHKDETLQVNFSAFLCMIQESRLIEIIP